MSNQQDKVERDKLLDELNNIDQFLNFKDPHPLYEYPQAKVTEVRTYECGRWTTDEHSKYLQVLKMNPLKDQLHSALVAAIPSRNLGQIRTHHKKMLKKYGTTERIVEHEFRASPSMDRIREHLATAISILQDVLYANELFSIADEES